MKKKKRYLTDKFLHFPLILKGIYLFIYLFSRPEVVSFLRHNTGTPFFSSLINHVDVDEVVLDYCRVYQVSGR